MATKSELSKMEAGVCRLCATNGATQHIFGDELHVQAMSCARIQISPGDGLPESVCDKCSNQIKQFYEFKQQCENSDRSFRTLLSISNGNLKEDHFEIKQEITFEDDNKNDITFLYDGCNSDFDSTPEDGFSFDETLFVNTIKRTEDKDADSKLHKGINVDNKENRSHKLENKTLYPMLRIRRESLMSDNKSEGLKHKCESKAAEPVPPRTNDPRPAKSTEICICKICGKKFNKEKQLRRHSCDSLLKSKKILKKDSIKFQKKGVLNFLKLRAKEKDSQNEHFMESRNYMCDICGQVYKKLNILLQHQTTHSDTKNFNCTLCKKNFTRSSHLTAHMRIHNNIKPYVCETCGVSFVKSSDLSRHKRIHSDIRNYACPVCPRRFKRSGDVTSHMRVHTGDRPYKCKMCDKAYSSHSSLQKHKKLNCHINQKFGDDAETSEVKPKTEVQVA